MKIMHCRNCYNRLSPSRPRKTAACASPPPSRTPPRAQSLTVRRMLVKLLLFAALFALLSIAALYSYGRFAERSLGAPGTAFARGGRCHPARPRAGAAAGAAPAASGTA
jgi:putative cardiolipin synthase